MKDRIRRILAGHRLTAAEVGAKVGCSRKQALRLLDEMPDVTSERVGNPAGGNRRMYRIGRNLPLLQEVWRGIHDSPRP
jgi:hypothetical protein